MPEEENVAVESVRVRGTLPHKRRINLAKITRKRLQFSHKKGLEKQRRIW